MSLLRMGLTTLASGKVDQIASDARHQHADANQRRNCP